MNKTYQFNITGMTCHACESLITMDLTDAGFTPKTLNHATGILTIELDENSVNRVKELIEASKTYKVTNVTPL